MMDSQSLQFQRTPISLVAQFGYSIGHILNDLCASCWFSYLLYFFTNILKKSQGFAGALMLVGQIADGVATPIVGFLIDKIRSPYGKRKTFHAIGTVLVAVSFAFIFHECLPCKEGASATASAVYFGSFIVLFQFGWASTQISHLSLIPVLTVCKKKIVFLNSVRSGLTFVCGIAVYCIMWALLHNSKSQMQPTSLGDKEVFSNLSYIVVGVGTSFSILFHLLVRESSDEELTSQLNEQTALTAPVQQRVIRDWFKLDKFYLVGLLYMFTRLAVNIPQVYLPFFLTDTLSLAKESIAYYPLMMLVCSVVGSFLCKALTKVMNKVLTYCVGVLLVIGACTWFWFLDNVHHCYTYGPTALIGAGSSIMLIISLSMTADLIGVNTNTGAFVYGCMSLLDKISNGVTVALIQFYHPSESGEKCPVSRFYRRIMTFVPSATAVCGAISITIVYILTVYRRRQTQHNLLINERESTTVENTAALLSSDSSESERGGHSSMGSRNYNSITSKDVSPLNNSIQNAR